MGLFQIAWNRNTTLSKIMLWTVCCQEMQFKIRAKLNIQKTKMMASGPISSVQFSSVHFSHSVMSSSLRPHGLQHARVPCPSPTPGAWSNSSIESVMPSNHLISFSSHLQSFPASGSFQMSQLFASGGQTIGVSASTLVIPMNIQDWFPLRWTGWISLQSKGLSRVFSNTTVQKHQFFSAQLSL